jgi:DNA mismatch repair ATPase MutS
VRLLRSNLFQPPIDPETIGERHEAVAEIIRAPELYNGLKMALARFPDLEQILSLCVQAAGPPALSNLHQIDMKMDRMVGLRQVLEYLPPLASLLEGAASRLLVRARDLLTSLTAGSALLLQMVQLGALLVY